MQFYGDDSFLLDGLSRFIGSALGAGDGSIVIATKAHCDGLAKRLRSSGLDVAMAIQHGRYISLDAAETLSKFMVDGWPDLELFHQAVGSIIAQSMSASRTDQPRIAAFGEMVALLWAEGKSEAAIRLEQLWNDLARTQDFHLHATRSKSARAENRKELFLRSLRDLMPVHIKLMSDLLPANHPDQKQTTILWVRRQKCDKYNETDRLLVQQLVALGFIEETISPLDARKNLTSFTPFGPKQVDTRRIAELLAKPPNIVYKISRMGCDFLAFIGIVATSK